ncbi:non-heme iron oxygenase ferredoxin subunit [Amycolatopsis anabasis]|uniref:non-heme iron oxygenase ferredoxin subunit n=1 Tax=Amycolatopsis anabasis TaxID=1840409 RepID=UPI00131E71EA|nr:non-heme iron oxygenase ferredoxin subunit [Amycolatopsis anabasis]
MSTAPTAMVPVCPAAELALNEPRQVETPWGLVALVRTGTGIYAVADRCSHDDVELSDGFVDGDTVECPAHFSQFCLRTGAALTMPAVEPVETWTVAVIDGVIHLGSRQ